MVLEGIDGSGTTTQVARLADRLRAEHAPVRTTREPSDGPIGTLVRQVLTGRVVVPGGRAPGWATMALLFAADRMDHVECEIEPFVSVGGRHLSDRYDASSLAYQSVSSGVDGERGASSGSARSTDTRDGRTSRSFSTCLPDVAAERRDAARRGRPALRAERGAACARHLSTRTSRKHLPKDRIVIVDGVGTVDEVHERVWAAYEKGFAG